MQTLSWSDVGVLFAHCIGSAVCITENEINTNLHTDGWAAILTCRSIQTKPNAHVPLRHMFASCVHESRRRSPFFDYDNTTKIVLTSRQHDSSKNLLFLFSLRRQRWRATFDDEHDIRYNSAYWNEKRKNNNNNTKIVDERWVSFLLILVFFSTSFTRDNVRSILIRRRRGLKTSLSRGRDLHENCFRLRVFVTFHRCFIKYFRKSFAPKKWIRLKKQRSWWKVTVKGTQ